MHSSRSALLIRTPCPCQVRACSTSRVKYSYSCDWFSCGVLLYELQEKACRFGDLPEYEDLGAEFVQPELLDESGVEVSPLESQSGPRAL